MTRSRSKLQALGMGDHGPCLAANKTRELVGAAAYFWQRPPLKQSHDQHGGEGIAGTHRIYRRADSEAMMNLQAFRCEENAPPGTSGEGDGPERIMCKQCFHPLLG